MSRNFDRRLKFLNISTVFRLRNRTLLLRNGNLWQFTAIYGNLTVIYPYVVIYNSLTLQGLLQGIKHEVSTQAQFLQVCVVKIANQVLYIFKVFLQLLFQLIYIKSYIDSSIVKPLSSTFAKVFRVNNLFNGPLLVVLIFVLILDQYQQGFRLYLS